MCFCLCIAHPIQPSSSESLNQTTALQRHLAATLNNYNRYISDKHVKLYNEIDDLKEIMVANIDKVLQRDEQIGLLVEKTEQLHDSSFQFRKNATYLKREMWWRNMKLMMMIAAAIVFVIYILMAMGCGGLSLPSC